MLVLPSKPQDPALQCLDAPLATGPAVATDGESINGESIDGGWVVQVPVVKHNGDLSVKMLRKGKGEKRWTRIDVQDSFGNLSITSITTSNQTNQTRLAGRIIEPTVWRFFQIYSWENPQSHHRSGFDLLPCFIPRSLTLDLLRIFDLLPNHIATSPSMIHSTPRHQVEEALSHTSTKANDQAPNHRIVANRWIPSGTNTRNVFEIHSLSESLHGSLNVPIEHHPTIRYMVNAMATIRW
jgi:hypothetical protein